MWKRLVLKKKKVNEQRCGSFCGYNVQDVKISVLGPNQYPQNSPAWEPLSPDTYLLHKPVIPTYPQEVRGKHLIAISHSDAFFTTSNFIPKFCDSF